MWKLLIFSAMTLISLECRFILRYTVIVTEHSFSNASQKGKALHEYVN